MNISLLEESIISIFAALATYFVINTVKLLSGRYRRRQIINARLARLTQMSYTGFNSNELINIWQLPVAYWLKTKSGKSFRDKVIKARLKSSPLDIAGKMFLLSLVAILIGLLILNSFLSAVVLVFGLYFANIMWLRTRISTYQRNFTGQLPSTLMLIANSLSSGSSLTQAFQYGARESRPPIKNELSKVVEQLSIGVNLDKALEKLYQDIKVPELETIISALIIQRRAGGNLAKLLKRTSELLREKNDLKNELMVQTAQSRFSGKIIGLMPVVVIGFLTIVDREFIAPLFTTSLGMLILLLSSAAELVGFLLIRRILDISF